MTISPRTPSSFLLGLLLTTACTAGGSIAMDPGGSAGKSDTADERCASAAPDDSGTCRASDGTFAPASCCEAEDELGTFACTFDEPIFVVDNSIELSDFILNTETVARDGYDSLTKLQQRQIRAAATHLSFLAGGETVDELFSSSVTDDKEFILSSLIVDADIPFEGDWVKFFAGDTEVGVVFDAETMTIVAEVSDGDIMNCTEVSEVQTFSCTFDLPIFGVDNSGELANSVVESTTIESQDFDSLDELRQQQLYVAAVHLSFLDGSEPARAVFENNISDDKNYIYSSLSIDGELAFDGQWVKFFAGDTEVGVIFAAGTTDIVGEVSDGDIKACVAD